MSDPMLKVKESAEDLDSTLNRINKYLSLFYVTWKMIVATLVFLAVALLIDNVVYVRDFQVMNSSLGSISLSNSNFGGTFLDVLFFCVFVGAILVYVFSVHLNRIFFKGQKWKVHHYDSAKGPEEVVRFITGTNWEDTISDLKRAKISFILYNVSLVGVYSFLLFFVLLFGLSFGIAASRLISIYLLFPYYSIIAGIIAVFLSVVILRKRLHSSASELWETDEILKQLRWFADEFEKSGFQT